MSRLIPRFTRQRAPRESQPVFLPPPGPDPTAQAAHARERQIVNGGSHFTRSHLPAQHMQDSRAPEPTALG